MDAITQVLNAIEQGDPHAASQLLPLVYDELRKLAAAQMADEKPGQILQPTALVHEAHVRLVGPEPDQHWGGRANFFAAAAEAMRWILLDAARRKGRRKRGGGMARRDLDGIDPAVPESSDDLLALDEALGQLTAADPQAAELVRLRFYAGLPILEVARILGISPRTADRTWAYARAWLHQAVAGVQHAVKVHGPGDVSLFHGIGRLLQVFSGESLDLAAPEVQAADHGLPVGLLVDLLLRVVVVFLSPLCMQQHLYDVDAVLPFVRATIELDASGRRGSPPPIGPAPRSDAARRVSRRPGREGGHKTWKKEGPNRDQLIISPRSRSWTRM
jgi:RNA polymerase sigma factor (TIGR02999 family)